MGNRHKAREFALQLLYALDLNSGERRWTVFLFWQSIEAPDEVRQFAMKLVNGVNEHLDLIDETILRCSEHWTIDRMSGVDRNVLRMAAYELLFLDDIPPKVTINEAVEIGKKFGANDSGAFVNGVLDQIAKERQEARS